MCGVDSDASSQLTSDLAYATMMCNGVCAERSDRAEDLFSATSSLDTTSWASPFLYYCTQSTGCSTLRPLKRGVHQSKGPSLSQTLWKIHEPYRSEPKTAELDRHHVFINRVRFDDLVAIPAHRRGGGVSARVLRMRPVRQQRQLEAALLPRTTDPGLRASSTWETGPWSKARVNNDRE